MPLHGALRYNPVTFAPSLDPEGRAVLGTLLGPLGDFFEVAEADLEAYAVITAMGPTNLWPQLDELETMAESFGLSPEEARAGLNAMVAGALQTMTDAGLGADEVMDLVPVKPIGGGEERIREIYQENLRGLYRKLTE